MSHSVSLEVTGDKPFGVPDQPYERLLEDAMKGDPRRFGRAESVDEQWRIVQRVIDHPPPVRIYEPGMWGPPEAALPATPYGGWIEPMVPSKP